MGVGSQLHVPAALPPGKRPGIYCTGGWVGPRAGPNNNIVPRIRPRLLYSASFAIYAAVFFLPVRAVLPKQQAASLNICK
jgi:hypothetical protein